MIEGIFLSSLSFLLFLIAHIIVFRLFLLHHRWKTVVGTAFVTFILYTVAFYQFPFPGSLEATDPLRAWTEHAGYINGALLFIFLFFSYAQFYFLVDRGVSARILIDILNSPTGRMTREEILASYNPRALQDRRLTDMLYGHYIEEKNGKYCLTKKGLRNARIFLAAKRLLRLYPGG